MTPIEKHMLYQQVERVFHAPCNRKMKNLEWTIIIDHNLAKEEVESLVKESILSLKQRNDIFRSARLNIVEWLSDKEITHQNVPMPRIQIGDYFAEYRQIPQKKKLEQLAAELKFYEARSKLFLLFTDGSNEIIDKEKWKQEMNPFLFQRFLSYDKGKCTFFQRF